jgi:hypothetical protein
MFVRVQPDKLVVGTKYKIAVFPYDVEFDRYSGIFKESMIFPNYTYLKFERPYDLILKEMCVVSSVFLCKYNYYYYVFVSDQPQWKMERRAVNLIVRRLIGDECFEW